MLKKVVDRGLIKGVLTNVREQGVIVVLYADDTVIFSSDEENHIRNLKCTLLWFEQISGMHINFHKSEVLAMNLDEYKVHLVAYILGCPVGILPIKYLGVPLHFDKQRREDIQSLVDKIIRKIVGWRGRLLSYSGRLILIRTCISSIPTYLVSFIKFPKWAINLINSHMSHFLRNNFAGHHAYHLVN